MANGTKIRGIDGVITTLIDSVKEEFPCLTDWTLSGQANNETDDTSCMLSNADGGSDATSAGVSRTPGTPDYTLSAEYYWQKNVDGSDPAGNAAILDITELGKEFEIELFPHRNETGERFYKGGFLLESFDITSSSSDYIKASVSFGINGALTKGIVT